MTQEDTALKLYLVLARATETINKKLALCIRGYGLNTTEFGVLELLFHKGDQPIQKIGDKILIASSSITYVVDKLEKKGYLARVSCPVDRRVIYATLTEAGRDLISEVFPKHKTTIYQLFDHFTESEQLLLTSQLKKLGYYAQDLDI